MGDIGRSFNPATYDPADAPYYGESGQPVAPAYKGEPAVSEWVERKFTAAEMSAGWGSTGAPASPVLAPVYFKTESGAWTELNDAAVLVGIFDGQPEATGKSPQPTAWIVSGEPGAQTLKAATGPQVRSLKAAGLL